MISLDRHRKSFGITMTNEGGMIGKKEYYKTQLVTFRRQRQHLHHIFVLFLSLSILIYLAHTHAEHTHTLFTERRKEILSALKDRVGLKSPGILCISNIISLGEQNHVQEFFALMEERRSIHILQTLLRGLSRINHLLSLKSSSC